MALQNDISPIEIPYLPWRQRLPSNAPTKTAPPAGAQHNLVFSLRGTSDRVLAGEHIGHDHASICREIRDPIFSNSASAKLPRLLVGWRDQKSKARNSTLEETLRHGPVPPPAP